MNDTLPFRTLLCLCVTTCLVTPMALAVNPPPDGGYPGQNTAEGEDALFSLTTATGVTALGYHALYSNTTGGINTAVGSEALESNIGGYQNSAVGRWALKDNTTGNYN